jgi:sterol desaturase/sphingolipid hydroxylase (fatty acid hydroxylase superfamily)
VPSTSSLVPWLVDHAVLLLAASVLVTVVGEQLTALARRRADLAGSLTSVTGGVAYLAAKGLVSKGLMFGVALAVYEHRLVDLDWTSPAVWIGVFVARDLAYYWIHRAEHRVRVLWASHMIHHSLERFTFTSAVRLPWMESLYKPVLFLWVPLLGFHPAAFAAMGALVLMAGQLQHTELVRRRTVLDLVFVTPAAHRVHHGSNPEYLDKNFGSLLIVWDRLFGTYAAETAPVRFGLVGAKRVTTPAQVLVGGYPSLVASARTRRGALARSRFLLSPP